jgi:hypothetical protein
MIDPDAVVGRALSARTRRVGDKQLVARGQNVMELNEVAAAIWKMADGRRTAMQIGEQLAAEYEVSTEEALADVVEFVSEMIGANFMTVRDKP